MQLAAIMNHLLMKMKKTQLLTTIQNKHLRRKKIQDLLFGDPIIPSRPTTVTMLTSKNGKEVWHTDLTVNGGRRRVSNVLKTAPGPMRYANKQVDTVRSSFELFIRKPLVEIICKWTNEEGRVCKDKWNDVTVEELYKVIGLMVLIGVYKSKNEDICQVWSLENGCHIFNKIIAGSASKMLSGL